MTSKTFKSTAGGFSIGIRPVEDGVQFRITNMRGNYQQFNTPASVAAEQALTILEAAGFDDVDSGNISCAVADLRAYIERQERITAEARERAELEAEALELFNVVREHDGEPRVATWGGFHAGTMEVYLLLARRARELAKEATK